VFRGPQSQRPTLVNDLTDLPYELRLDEQLFGIRQTKILEDIAGARRHPWLSAHRSVPFFFGPNSIS
jgi:hypothetical protein